MLDLSQLSTATRNLVITISSSWPLARDWGHRILQKVQVARPIFTKGASSQPNFRWRSFQQEQMVLAYTRSRPVGVRLYELAEEIEIDDKTGTCKTDGCENSHHDFQTQAMLSSGTRYAQPNLVALWIVD